MAQDATVCEGWTAPGWEGVRAAFTTNMTNGSEVGAAFSAYHRGEKVVDLWGGVADAKTGAPWQEDTIVLVYSTTKGLTAMCANRLADQGLLDVDAPVGRYWPEFGQAGKQDVPVSYLLSHQVGLAYTDDVMSYEDALAWDPVIKALESQAPHWVPGSQHGYHATTYGWLVGELVRRVSGRSLGTYFHDEIAVPLGAHTWIGLPESEEGRVARLTMGSLGGGGSSGADDIMESSSLTTMIDNMLGPGNTLSKALTAPGGALSAGNIWNQRSMRAAEVPAANGVTDARSLARCYAACIGEVDGYRVFSDKQMELARTQQTSGPNTILFGIDLQFGLGFMLHFDLMPVGGAGSFGHFGAGGSVGWADPEVELAAGYVMNRMDIGMVGDARSTRLFEACYAAIG
jgi:CubicO group peptidase (beta-lactamase class C family)